MQNVSGSGAVLHILHSRDCWYLGARIASFLFRWKIVFDFSYATRQFISFVYFWSQEYNLIVQIDQTKYNNVRDRYYSVNESSSEWDWITDTPAWIESATELEVDLDGSISWIPNCVQQFLLLYHPTKPFLSCLEFSLTSDSINLLLFVIQTP